MSVKDIKNATGVATLPLSCSFSEDPANCPRILRIFLAPTLFN